MSVERKPQVFSRDNLELREVGEGLVGFGHAVSFFFFLHRIAGVVIGVY